MSHSDPRPVMVTSELSLSVPSKHCTKAPSVMSKEPGASGAKTRSRSGFHVVPAPVTIATALLPTVACCPLIAVAPSAMVSSACPGPPTENPPPFIVVVGPVTMSAPCVPALGTIAISPEMSAPFSTRIWPSPAIRIELPTSKDDPVPLIVIQAEPVSSRASTVSLAIEITVPPSETLRKPGPRLPTSVNSTIHSDPAPSTNTEPDEPEFAAILAS